MAGMSQAMTQINSMAFFWGHCHGKRREIKPEQLGRLGKPHCRAPTSGR
jgi:hypothetical protein